MKVGETPYLVLLQLYQYSVGRDAEPELEPHVLPGAGIGTAVPEYTGAFGGSDSD